MCVCLLVSLLVSVFRKKIIVGECVWNLFHCIFCVSRIKLGNSCHWVWVGKVDEFLLLCLCRVKAPCMYVQSGQSLNNYVYASNGNIHNYVY